MVALGLFTGSLVQELVWGTEDDTWTWMVWVGMEISALVYMSDMWKTSLRTAKDLSVVAVG